MSKPLPRVCPGCGDSPGHWALIHIADRYWDYECTVCGYPAEIFYDSAQGRIKYVPEVKDVGTSESASG